MRFADLGAVTVDAFGTLVRLADPVPALERALRARGVQPSREEIAAAFRAEVRYYVEHKLEGRDAESLARLRSTCAGVFLDALGAGLDPEEFAPGLVGALEFEPLPGAVDTLTALRLRGLRLAAV